jgi:hypothetical protein
MTLPFALAITFGLAAAAGDNPAPPSASRSVSSTSNNKETGQMKIRLKLGDTTATATLLDSRASRDFWSLLPLTLKMNDLFRREKYSHLPRAISEEGRRTHRYEIGDIAYWPPSSDLAVYYRHDGETIPEPGIIVLGRIDSGVETFAFSGSRIVTTERVE